MFPLHDHPWFLFRPNIRAAGISALARKGQSAWGDVRSTAQSLLSAKHPRKNRIHMFGVIAQIKFILDFGLA